jgi:hypothetical protein
MLFSNVMFKVGLCFEILLLHYLLIIKLHVYLLQTNAELVSSNQASLLYIMLKSYLLPFGYMFKPELNTTEKETIKM